MYRIDATGSVLVMPTPLTAGTPGFFQDTSPSGGAIVPADWLNHVQEEISGAIEDLGGTLSKASVHQLRDALALRVKGLRVHPTDTGVVSADVTRGVILATNSRATGVTSAVLAGSGNIASGDGALVEGSLGSIASGAGAIVLSSLNCELHDAGAVGGGGSITPITPTGANQNVKWKVLNDGSAHLAGKVRVGGDPDNNAPPAEKIFLDATNGNIGGKGGQNWGCTDAETGAGAKASVDGSTGKVHSAGGIVLPVVSDGPSGYAVFSGTTHINPYNDPPWNSGSIANASISATSIVLWSFTSGTPGSYSASYLCMGHAVVTAGHVTFYLVNPLTVALIVEDLRINYVVINPA